MRKVLEEFDISVRKENNVTSLIPFKYNYAVNATGQWDILWIVPGAGRRVLWQPSLSMRVDCLWHGAPARGLELK